MKTLLIFAVITLVGINYADGARLVGAERCTWGPSYWCQNYTSASECHVLSNCKSKWWATGKPTGNLEGSKICNLCKDTLNKIQGYLKNNETRSMCRKDLDALCSEMKGLFPQLAQECGNIVDSNFDNIYNDIIHLTDPSVVCYGLGLCKNEEDFARQEDKFKFDKKAIIAQQNNIFSPFMAPVPIFGATLDDGQTPK